MRKTYSGPMTKSYSGRGENADLPQTPNLRKLPALRQELKSAVDQGRLGYIAHMAGCKTQDLKPFISGSVNKLGGGIRSRLIAVLSPDR